MAPAFRSASPLDVARRDSSPQTQRAGRSPPRSSSRPPPGDRIRPESPSPAARPHGGCASAGSSPDCAGDRRSAGRACVQSHRGAPACGRSPSPGAGGERPRAARQPGSVAASGPRRPSRRRQPLLQLPCRRRAGPATRRTSAGSSARALESRPPSARRDSSSPRSPAASRRPSEPRPCAVSRSA